MEHDWRSTTHKDELDNTTIMIICSICNLVCYIKDSKDDTFMSVCAVGENNDYYLAFVPDKWYLNGFESVIEEVKSFINEAELCENYIVRKLMTD